MALACQPASCFFLEMIFFVRFDFYKKNNKTELFLKKNQNRTEIGLNRPVSVQFGFLG
jgi:hypothetical protein